jgi:hypothetical protein
MRVWLGSGTGAVVRAGAGGMPGAGTAAEEAAEAAAGAAVDDALASTRTAQLASLAEQADIRRGACQS